MKYNHDRPLEDFQEDINRIKQEGFNPIAVTQMGFEDTFVFETAEEATNAYEKLELNSPRKSNVIGWWYGKEDFLKVVESYKKDFHFGCDEPIEVLIYWL
jgi:hypothetical protein